MQRKSSLMPPVPPKEASESAGATPTVSVAMITYNHERFIAQAIESVLMQQTDFPVELVIGEDCSPDDTRAIVLDYRDRCPDRIRLLLPERNLGMIPNFVATLSACRGQYIALCEGDDYWTDPLKLQKQVEFLEQYADYAICYHKVLAFCDDQSSPPHYRPDTPYRRTTTLEDLLTFNYLPTCSVMFRNMHVEKLPDWFFSVPMGDWVLHVLNAQHGRIAYLDDVMGANRIHSGGVWSGVSDTKRFLAIVDFYSHINAYLDYKYDRLIGASVSNCYLELAALLADQNDTHDSKNYLRRSVAQSPSKALERWQDVLAMSMRLYMPRIHRALGDIASKR